MDNTYVTVKECEEFIAESLRNPPPELVALARDIVDKRYFLGTGESNRLRAVVKED